VRLEGLSTYQKNLILYQIEVGLDLFAFENKSVPGNREVREIFFKTLMNYSVSEEENAEHINMLTSQKYIRCTLNNVRKVNA
jgi:hypothetical protein